MRSLDQLPLEVQREIDDRCDQFELAWKNGKTPALEDELAQCAADALPHLLGELLAIEVEYRGGENGQFPDDEEILAWHPDYRREVAAELERLRRVREGLWSSATPSDAVETASGYKEQAADSVGLKIRCPHCNNAVELLAQSADDDVTCHSCGSVFNLVENDPPGVDGSAVRTLGRFQLMAPLGVGGFGTVWKAHDEELDRFVAVKIPRKRQLVRAEMELFFREARTAAQLRHSHIVPIHEIGREPGTGTVYIVSDFIQGVSLMDWMREHRLSPPEIAELGAVIADALHYAHEQGIIHRDLKPSNVMIDGEGEPHVMDFGLAKREAGEITMTVDGHLLGTPAYMSPEQARGEAHWTDRRSDIYSLGVMLYELATGELPFRGNAQMQVEQRLTRDAPDPRQLNPHVPRDLATICLKCLERDPNGRYSTAGEVADELRRFVRGEPVRARPIGRTERVIRWSKRNPLAAALIGLTAFLAVAGPIAAVVLESQRRMLATRDRERDELMQRYVAVNRQVSLENAGLQEELDALTGGAPGVVQFVPSWRRNLIKEFIDGQYETIASQVAAAGPSPSTARTHFGLGMLLQELGRTSDAAGHYESAAGTYAALVSAHPDQHRYQRAEAECYDQLARLWESQKESSTAKLWADRALEIRASLAAANPSEVSPQVKQLESHMASLELEDDPLRRQRRLSEETQSLKEQVTHAWPSDPRSVYEVAKVLTLRDPLPDDLPTE